MRTVPAADSPCLFFAPIWRRLRGLVLLVLATGVALAASDEWRYVRTENFELLSQASEKKTRKLVAELEQFRASFIETFRLRPAHEPRVTVVLFDSDKRFTPYKPTYKGQPKDVSGYFVGGDDETVIALNLDVEMDEESSPAETIFHEYVHLLLHTRGMKLPTWLNEGLAEVFSTFQVNGNTVVYGRPKQIYVDVLGVSALMPMGRMMAVDETSPDYNEESRAGMFYAQAWALSHFLVCGEDRTNAAKLAKFLAVMDTAPADPGAAFKEVFGIGFDKLEQQLRNYLQGGRYFTRRVPAPLKDFAAKVVVRPATELERDLALTNLRWRVHRSGETMLAALHFADKNPTWPRPQELLGAVAAADGDVTSALARWTKAAELGSVNPFVLVQGARAKLLDLGGVFDLDERLTPADAVELRRWLDRAVQLSPAYDDAWEVLAHVESRSAEFRIAMVNELQTRVRGMKDPNATLLSLAVIRWRAKDLSTAIDIAKAVTESSRARPEIKSVAHLLLTKFNHDSEALAKPADARGPKAVTDSTAAAGSAARPVEDDPSTPTLPFPMKKSGKAGAVVRPPAPPRVQALRLPTEAALLATGASGESGATLPPPDAELAERVAAAVADAVAKGVGAQPVAVYRATATYPVAQRRAGIAGEAKVRFTIDATGHPENVREAGSTVPDFAKAAVESVKQWRFLPGIREGKPVSTLVELTLTFGAEGVGK